jgi:hypothetical protein
MDPVQYYGFVYSEIEESENKIAWIASDKVPENIREMLQKMYMIRTKDKKLKSELKKLESDVHTWFYGDDDVTPAIYSMNILKHVANIQGSVQIFDLTIDY